MKTNLFLSLGQRLLGFPKRIWRNLGTNPKYRVPKTLGYSLGAASVAYSSASLFFNLNIDFSQIFYLPFFDFFRVQVLPFLVSPLVLVGLDLDSFWQALIALSSIGGAVMANAEFRTRQRLSRHFLVKRETGPRFDPDFLKNHPGMPDPPKHSLLTRVLVFVAALMIGYSFVGLIGFGIFISFGIYFFARDLRYVAAFLLSNVLYLCERVLAPYERWGDNQYWGTRWFLAVFTKRQDLDEFVDRAYVEFWRVESLDPRQRHWMAARNLISDGARVIATALWLALFLAAVRLSLSSI